MMRSKIVCRILQLYLPILTQGLLEECSCTIFLRFERRKFSKIIPVSSLNKSQVLDFTNAVDGKQIGKFRKIKHAIRMYISNLEMVSESRSLLKSMEYQPNHAIL